jgi:hypothetical protein
VKGFQFARGFGHEQAHLPVAGVKAEGDGLPVFRAQAAVRAEDKELGIEKAIGTPAHAGVLRQAEEIARRLGQQHLLRQRQNSRRATGVRSNMEKTGVCGLQHRAERDGCYTRILF